MRKALLIGVIAATALTSPAVARDRHHHDRDRHHHSERHRDRHHDWRDRHHHRRVAYVSPYRGWNYRRLSVGHRLRPAFYGPRYTISDYGYYRIAAPRRYHRWIQYGPDLLLIDIRSGRVLQVLPNRFY